MITKKYSHLYTYEGAFSDAADYTYGDEGFWDQVINKIGNIRGVTSNKDIMMDIGEDYIYFGLTLGNTTWNLSFHNEDMNNQQNIWEFSACEYPNASIEIQLNNIILVNDVDTMASFLAVILAP